MNSFTPRHLLQAYQVAEKFGRSESWFKLHRQRLELHGFPQPTLPKDDLGPEEWDERAIDLWMDSRLDRHLKPEGTIEVIINRPDDLAARLHQRAQEMSL